MSNLATKSSKLALKLNVVLALSIHLKIVYKMVDRYQVKICNTLISSYVMPTGQFYCDVTCYLFRRFSQTIEQAYECKNNGKK